MIMEKQIRKKTRKPRKQWRYDTLNYYLSFPTDCYDIYSLSETIRT